MKSNWDSLNAEFESKYKEYKQGIKELKKKESETKNKISNKKAIVKTWNDLIRNYRSQNEPRQKSKHRQNEEIKEKEKFLDLIAESMCNVTTEVQNGWEEMNTFVSNLIESKNKEINNAIQFVKQQKQYFDDILGKFNTDNNENN